MKCAIAKHNPLLLEQAIKHYRHSLQTFTFMSLYDDAEPFPIDEARYYKPESTRYNAK